MRDNEVHLDSVYEARVTGKLVPVRIIRKNTPYRGWTALNLETNREVRILSGRRLRRKLTIEDHPRPMKWPKI